MEKILNPSELLNLFNDTDLKSFASTLVPESTYLNSMETAVVSLHCPLTAALCFDRVWSIPLDGTNCPPEIAFNSNTDAELVSALLFHTIEKNKNEFEDLPDPQKLAKVLVDGDSDTLFQNHDLLAAYSAALFALTLVGKFEVTTTNILNGFNRTICDHLMSNLNRNVFPVYHHESIRKQDFKSGDYRVLVASLQHLEVVIEDHLTWEQVVEFRKDSESKTNFRQIIHWLDSQMVGKSNQFIIDEIGVKLDLYRAALRKHGVKTKIGVLSSLINSKALLSSLVTMGGSIVAGEPLWGSLATGGVLLGKVLISIGESKIELEGVREKYKDIAFLAQLDERKKYK